ncbi:FKBP-type peptidyl-prolyl cis-trans isomerase [Luteimonas yindakuii]|uniref:Peptidyl-prolyl cis-trans isomerase n=1 Tax=Luteimonas yindakuii TaxID=2565782 RepID=A0A4Z1R492_9GAMM|nr:FKBP-type peptidyl-prolyl cis-trans isomerase N-terminal domain-containing protein [Luteimonas yindakuii]QCO68006.1 FKBP-type peptidyl-prolyl cis-trans isomerase [Luteimonas yindakuii]TKS54352.1 FKBP-type peptidyl-prolyl cis-trans isomerase [Luteimonas yindakuii]
MKLRLLAASLAALTLTAGAAVAQDTSSEQGRLSYALGYDLGRNLIESGEQVDVNTVIKALQDGYARRDPTVPVDQLRSAVENMQQRQLAKARAEFERVAGENKTRSDAFLAQNRAKAGVQSLAGGVQYRVIEAGNGAKPTPNSEVSINYKGSLSTGQTFVDTSVAPEGQQAGPVSVRMDQIPLVGLREALAQMPTGARWEIVMPPEKAYGNSPQSPIGPNQAVVFDVKLVSIK